MQKKSFSKVLLFIKLLSVLSLMHNLQEARLSYCYDVTRCMDFFEKVRWGEIKDYGDVYFFLDRYFQRTVYLTYAQYKNKKYANAMTRLDKERDEIAKLAKKDPIYDMFLDLYNSCLALCILTTNKQNNKLNRRKRGRK